MSLGRLTVLKYLTTNIFRSEIPDKLKYAEAFDFCKKQKNTTTPHHLIISLNAE